MSTVSIRAAGGVLVKKENGTWKVALIQKKQSGLWMLPKGHLEETETPEEASQREVAEETGFDTLLGPHIGEISFSYTRNGRCHHESVDFYIMTPQAERTVQDIDEIQQVKWFTFEEAGTMLAFPGELCILQKGRGLLDS